MPNSISKALLALTLIVVHSSAEECFLCESNEVLVPLPSDSLPIGNVPSDSCSQFEWQMKSGTLSETACGYIKMHAESLCTCQELPDEEPETGCRPCPSSDEQIRLSTGDENGLCLSLQQLAEKEADMDSASCQQLQQVVAEKCGCGSTLNGAFVIEATETPTASPTTSPTDAVAESEKGLTGAEEGCRPCPNPAHEIAIEGSLDFCLSLKESAEKPGIPEKTCSLLQATVAMNCVCRLPDDFLEQENFPPEASLALVPEESDPSACYLCRDPNLEIIVPDDDYSSECYTLKVASPEDAEAEVCETLQLYAEDLGCECGSIFGEDQVSAFPSDAPSLMPVSWSTEAPSDAPSLVPSDAPSSIPSDSPSVTPSSSPSSPPVDPPSPESGSMVTPTDFVGHPVCNICGDGGVIGKPEGVPILGATQSTCAVLQARGDAGEIPEGVCAQLQSLSATPCQCRDSSLQCIPTLNECTVGDECCDPSMVCLGVCAPLVLRGDETVEDFDPQVGERPNARRVRGGR